MEAELAKEQAQAETPADAGKGEGKGGVDWRLDRGLALGLLDSTGQVPVLIHHIRKNSKRLISYGLKASSIKSDKEGAIMKKFFVDLPDKPYDAIVLEWIRKTIHPTLTEYLKDENHDENTLTERLAGLMLYFHDVVEREPEDFKDRAMLMLAASVDERHHGIVRSLVSMRRVREAKEGSTQLDYMLEAVADPGVVLSPNKDNKHMLLVACVAAIRFGQWQTAERIRGKLAEILKGVEETEGLLQAIDAHLEDERPLSSTPARRLRLAHAGDFKGIDNLEVLTQCTKVVARQVEEFKPAFAFSKVLAVKRRTSAEWMELSQEHAARLFPSEGSLIHFEGKQYPPLPKRHEFGVWGVERNKDQDSKPKDGEPFNEVHATLSITPAQQVLSFEQADSSEVGKVVARLHDLRDSKSSADDGAVVRTSDGLYIQPNAGISAFLDSDGGEPVRAWKGLDLIQLRSGLCLHVGELPDTNRRMFLSEDPRLIAAEVFKQLGMIDKSGKERMKAIIDRLQASDETIVKLLDETQLDSFEWDFTALDSFVSGVIGANRELADMLASRKSELLSMSDEQVAKEQVARIESLRKRAIEIRSKARATLKDTDSDMKRGIDEQQEKFFNELGKMSRKVTSHESRMSWFNDIETAIAEHEKKVAEVLDLLDGDESAK